MFANNKMPQEILKVYLMIKPKQHQILIQNKNFQKLKFMMKFLQLWEIQNEYYCDITI